MLLSIYPKELKTYAHTKPYSPVWIHNHQNLETTKMSFSRCVDKQGSIRTMEYCSVLKRNKLLNHGKICRNFKCINKWKKPGCILCDSSSMTWKRRDYGDSKKTSGCQGLGGGGGGGKGGMDRQNIEDSEGSENPLMTPCW